MALALSSLAKAGEEPSADPEMREIVRTLQAQVARQQQQLDDQAKRLEETEARADEADADADVHADETRSASGVSRFFEAVDLESWINVNYTWNSRGNGNTHIIGQNSNAPFHEDSHSFQVDQLWFRMDKAVSSESRAGFHADIAFGETARNAQLAFGGNDSVAVYTAYASYLAPGGYGGIRIDAGELWTLLGVEVVPAPENLNITRGIVWGIQPVNHTGVIVSTSVSNFSFAFGAVNAPLSDSAQDSDRNKAFTGRIAFEAEKFYIAASAIHGSRNEALEDSGIPDPDGGNFPVNNDSEKSDVTIANFVMTFDPTDDLTGWVDFTYRWLHPNGPDSNTYAWAAAARYALTETLGVASRFEMVVVDPSNGKATDEYSLTFTFDKAITDHLLARLEGRFDWGIDGKYRKAGTDYDDPSASNHQNLFVAEVIYQF